MVDLPDINFKEAGRAYCAALGIDPDAMRTGPDDKHPTLGRNKPMWAWAIPEIKKALALEEAMKVFKATQNG